MSDARKKTFFDDDENVKMMRETAEEVGLTQLLREMRDSDVWGITEIDKLMEALELLGEGQHMQEPLPEGRTLHLDITRDGLVSLWDHESDARAVARQQGGRYVPLKLTRTQERELRGE